MRGALLVSQGSALPQPLYHMLVGQAYTAQGRLRKYLDRKRKYFQATMKLKGKEDERVFSSLIKQKYLPRETGFGFLPKTSKKE